MGFFRTRIPGNVSHLQYRTFSRSIKVSTQLIGLGRKKLQLSVGDGLIKMRLTLLSSPNSRSAINLSDNLISRNFVLDG